MNFTLFQFPFSLSPFKCQFRASANYRFVIVDIDAHRGTNVLPEADQLDNMAEEERLQKEQERIDQIIPDKSVTDEEIAELLSGEAEVLKDHGGVLGVNFNRMMPKAGVFKNSEVFQALNDEQLKTQEEREKEYRNWTSFLQKPSRPPPQRRTTDSPRNTYRPVIVRQPKPKCAPDYRTSTPVSCISFNTNYLVILISLISFE